MQQNPPDHNLAEPFERLALGGSKTSPWDTEAKPPSYPIPNPAKPGQEINSSSNGRGFEFTPMASSAQYMVQQTPQQLPHQQRTSTASVWGAPSARPIAPTTAYNAQPATGSLFSNSKLALLLEVTEG